MQKVVLDSNKQVIASINVAKDVKKIAVGGATYKLSYDKRNTSNANCC